MKKRKRLLLALLALGCLAIALLWLGLWLTPPSHGITREVTARVQPGMTAAEVEAIMGMPPGFYRSDMVQGEGRHRLQTTFVVEYQGTRTMVFEVMFWYLEDASITLYLDGDGRVASIDAHFFTGPQRVRRWINRMLPGDW